MKFILLLLSFFIPFCQSKGSLSSARGNSASRQLTSSSSSPKTQKTSNTPATKAPAYVANSPSYTNYQTAGLLGRPSYNPGLRTGAALGGLAFLPLLSYPYYGRGRNRNQNARKFCTSSNWQNYQRQDIIDTQSQLKSMSSNALYSSTMTYDCNLEKSAQNIANRCPSPNSGENFGSKTNVYWLWSSSPITSDGLSEAAARNWYGFSENFSGSETSQSRLDSQGNWLNSGRLGCGQKQCSSSRNGFRYESVMVCIYQ